MPIREAGMAQNVTFYQKNENGELIEVGKFSDCEIETDVSCAYDEITHSVTLPPTSFSGTINIPSHKMSRRKFKKWCMSEGISRNSSELLCKCIAAGKGKLSYEDIYRTNIFTPEAYFILETILLRYSKYEKTVTNEHSNI